MSVAVSEVEGRCFDDVATSAGDALEPETGVEVVVDGLAEVAADGAVAAAAAGERYSKAASDDGSEQATDLVAGGENDAA